jgi:hypothetical protein
VTDLASPGTGFVPARLGRTSPRWLTPRHRALAVGARPRSRKRSHYVFFRYVNFRNDYFGPLARDPGRPALSAAYRRSHNLPATSTVQGALEALVEDELAERTGGGYRIAEPFLAEWIVRNGV